MRQTGAGGAMRTSGSGTSGGERPFTTGGGVRRALLPAAPRVALLVGILAGAAPLQAQEAAQEKARALVDRALDLMGGPAVEAVERVRLTMMTQWQRTTYRDVPWTDRPSFERHTDVRDYTIPAWRNTREFDRQDLVNIVRDSVATTDFGQGPQPQSVAYVDERDELFTYTPDRLVLLLRDAPDLRSAGDTLIGGEAHDLVHATLHGDLPVTVAFHAGTGLPGLLRFRKGHPNDFGLVPFGDMWVEVWYSSWNTFGAISIPAQWDIQRAGAPYKRMTVLGADFAPEFAAADSFHVSPESRAAYLESVRPMHDRPVDSVTLTAPGLAQVHGFGFPAGAVGGGDAWILLEAGHAPLSLERGREAMRSAGVEAIAAAVVVAARAGNGGVVSLVEDGVPVHTSVAAAPFLEVMLENAGLPARGFQVVAEGRWLEAGGVRLRLEPVDLPNVPGSLMIHVPELEWVYAPDAITPLDRRMVLERARALGWTVSRTGTARSLWEEV